MDEEEERAELPEVESSGEPLPSLYPDAIAKFNFTYSKKKSCKPSS